MLVRAPTRSSASKQPAQIRAGLGPAVLRSVPGPAPDTITFMARPFSPRWSSASGQHVAATADVLADVLESAVRAFNTSRQVTRSVHRFPDTRARAGRTRLFGPSVVEPSQVSAYELSLLKPNPGAMLSFLRTDPQGERP